MRSQEAIAHFKVKHHNPHYLSSVTFDISKISFFENINEAIQEGDIILIGIPSAFIQQVLQSVDKEVLKTKIILSAIKGMLPNENLLVNQYLEKEFHLPIEKYACITGPCHAEEIASEKLSYLTFASLDVELAKTIAAYFNTNYLNTIVTHDMYGVQYAAVLKNIYALGAGIAHGLDYGDNFNSVYITNCFKEMKEFLDVLSTHETHNYNTSAYLGDLLVTCYSLHSRNRTFGNYIGKGYSAKAASLELSMVAEGYNASKAIEEVSKKMKYELPIAHAVFSILWENKNAKKVFEELEENYL
jgi:glycerol-3-phosphate dehydrogenase (NAD(P)+)